MLWTLLLLAGAMLLGWDAYRRRSATKRRQADWGIAEFEGRRLLYSEQLFRAPRAKLVAKVDRAYEGSSSGQIELLELKTRPRHRIYRSDVIELSAQRIAVEEVDGRRVSDTAFILTECTRDSSRQLHRIQLLARDSVFALRDRREQILRGETSADATRIEALCRTCAYLDVCTLAPGEVGQSARSKTAGVASNEHP